MQDVTVPVNRALRGEESEGAKILQTPAVSQESSHCAKKKCGFFFFFTFPKLPLLQHFVI